MTKEIAESRDEHTEPNRRQDLVEEVLPRGLHEYHLQYLNENYFHRKQEWMLTS